MTGNAVTTAQPAKEKAPVVAGGPVAALVPRNLEEAFRVAQAMAVSGLAPRGIDKPEQILVAIMAGAELGLAPFQALQSFAVINGRPSIWGDGMIAVVRAHGFQVKEWLEGEGDNMVAHCTVTRPDNGEEITRNYSVADAKKAGLWNKQGPWQSSPKRMLQMRARAFACRDGAADVLRGFQMREEVEDYQPVRDVTPAKPTGMRARLEARGAGQGGFDAENVTAGLDEVLGGDTVPTGDAPAAEDAHVEDARPTLPEGLKTGADLQREQAGGDAEDDMFPGDMPR